MKTTMRAILLLGLSAAGTLLAASASVPPLRTVGDVNRGIAEHAHAGQAFDLTVTVCSLRFEPADPTLSVFDETGANTMMFEPLLRTNLAVTAGDRLRVWGRILLKSGHNRLYAFCDRLEFLGHGPAPVACAVRPEDLASGRHDNRLVRLTGVLRDVFNDEIDPTFTFLTVVSDNRSVNVAIPAVNESGTVSLRRLIGGKVSVTGTCTRSVLGGRQHVGRILCLSSSDDVRAQEPARPDPFDVSELASLTSLTPQDIATRERHRSCGQVLAAWEGSKALLRTPDGQVFRAEFATAPTPSAGAFVEVVGFPESDMYCIGLTRALWRKAAPWATNKPEVRSLTGEALSTVVNGRPCFDPLLQGQLVRIEGHVSGISTDGRHAVRLYLQNGGRLTPVDVSQIPALPPDLADCRIGVTGICVLNVDSWRPNAAFPQIREIFIVARTPDDITILAAAPWWTPARFLILLGALLASLIGFAIWNRQLKKAVEAKGRELEHEIIERIGSDFKVEERTRLAVELHDSLSQTLTGVAMKINAANRAIPPNGEVARRHLDLAARTLASCRGELKNCLWDLRNNALEDADMAEAVRRIITPHIGEATLNVRFAALRDRFTESTAHALLRIIRELATNAVRHGHATHVQIAGVVENQTLRISVRDDGCGFDVASAPGMELGHFGLEGIRERLREFDGTLEIESTPDSGTRAVITLTLPQEDISQT